MAQPFRTQEASDVQVDEVVRATQYNTLRTDVLNARGGLDFATLAEILATDPAVGDVALARNNGSVYVCYQAGTWTLHIEGPSQAPGKNYWDALKLTRVNSDDIRMGVGVARTLQDDFSIEVTAPFTKKLDELFAAGEGNGMRDSAGSLGAAKWFNLYLLSQANDITQTDLFASPKATTEELAASLPAGWDRHAFVGAIYWDGGGIRDFFHRGKEFRWKEPVTDVDNSTGTAGVFETATLRVPSLQDGTLVKVIVSLSGGDGAIVRKPGHGDSGAAHAIAIGGRNSFVEVLTNEAAEIEYTMLGSWGRIQITTVGWEDERGFGAKQPASQTLQLVTANSGDLAGGQGVYRPTAVWPDESGWIGISDKGPSGGLPGTFAMNSETHEVAAGTQLHMVGNIAKLRGPSESMMVFRPDGMYCALWARDKTTQVWHLVILDTSDKSAIAQAGAYNISGDAGASSPASASSEAIWDESRGRLFVPSNVSDIVIYNVSDPSNPSFVTAQAAAGDATRSYRAFRWSENKECIYAVGAGVFAVLTPSGSGNSFTENQILTWATSVVYTTLAHDGTTIICAGHAVTPPTLINLLAFDINPGDETDVTLHTDYPIQVNLLGDITANQAGSPRFATFRDDVFGAWHHVASTIAPSQYVTYDMSDLSDPVFLEELIHLVDPDNSHVASSQYELFDGAHTQIFAGDVDDDVTQSPGLSIVGYL